MGQAFNMRFVRMLLALLMVLTLASPPGGAANAPTSQGIEAAAAADCEHHQTGQALPEKSRPASDRCAGMTDGGLCCATLAEIVVGSLSHDAGMGAALEPVRLDGPSLSWLTAPPLRPPRI